jgi:peptidoglycan/LPS O-acetylase OafA/YrhL
VSIVPVFWHHCTLGPLPGILGKGPLGVDFFFVLSGFLITTLLLRERDATGRIDARAFYARRALRIFPLYYGVLALYVLYAWLGMSAGPQRAHFFASLPFFATYTTNWFVDFNVSHPVSFAFSWSLASEEQFYLVWPWVLGVAALGAARSRRARWLAPLVSLVLLGLDQGVEHGLWVSLLPLAGLARRVVGSIASPIVLGALLAQILHLRRGFAWLDVVLGQRPSAALLFALLILAAYLDGVPLWLAQLLMTLVVGACCVRADHSLAWLTDGGAIRWVGMVSYGIYLFHVPLITLGRRVCPGLLATPGAALVAMFPVTLLVAHVSFVTIERPLLARRRRLATGL